MIADLGPLREAFLGGGGGVELFKVCTTSDSPACGDWPVAEKPVDLPNCCVCLDEEPSGMLRLSSCPHSAHFECLKRQLEAKWSGKRVSFNFLKCGECRTPLSHPRLTRLISGHAALKKKVEEICIARCLEDDAIEGLHEMLGRPPKPIETVVRSLGGAAAEDVSGNGAAAVPAAAVFEASLKAHPRKGVVEEPATPSVPSISASEKSERARAAVDICVSTMAVYPCSKCGEVFCAGRVDCAENEDLDTTVLFCQECAFREQPANNHKCKLHGFKFAIYKCDSCCSVAT